MGRVQGGMAVEGSGGHGVTLEAQLRWCWGLPTAWQPTLSSTAQPPAKAGDRRPRGPGVGRLVGDLAAQVRRDPPGP